MSNDIGAVLAGIVEEASAVIMPFCRAANSSPSARPGFSSPVTEADHAGEKVIVARLNELYPEIPVIAEELGQVRACPRPSARASSWSDPVDGTKAFVRGDTHFTVNIGLIQDGVPVAGAVAAPAQKLPMVHHAPEAACGARSANRRGERVTDAAVAGRAGLP